MAAPIPGFYSTKHTPGHPFGKSGPGLPLEAVQKKFIRELEGLSKNGAPANTLRMWAEWWAYAIAADVAATTAAGDAKLDAGLVSQLDAWRRQLAEFRDNAAEEMAVCGPGWRERSAALLEILAEGIEAAQGDFLSPLLELGLNGTNKRNSQFFTPAKVSLMIGRMAFGQPRHGELHTICDPCCGCGSIPIASCAAYLEAGGRKEDLAVDMGDIDSGAVCMGFLQFCALMIPCKAQVRDGLTNKPFGPLMVSPAYVLFQTGRRLHMKAALETLDDALRMGRGKDAAEGPTTASGGSGATTIPQEAEDGLHGASAGRNGPSPATEGKIWKRKAVPTQGTLF